MHGNLYCVFTWIVLPIAGLLVSFWTSSSFALSTALSIIYLEVALVEKSSGGTSVNLTFKLLPRFYYLLSVIYTNLYSANQLFICLFFI